MDSSKASESIGLRFYTKDLTGKKDDREEDVIKKKSCGESVGMMETDGVIISVFQDSTSSMDLDHLPFVVDDEDSDYSCPLEVRYNSWIRGCSLDIKLCSRIFCCESMKELKDFKAKMKADGQDPTLSSCRKRLLCKLEYRMLWKYEMLSELIAFVPYIEVKDYSVEEKEAFLITAKEKNLVHGAWFEHYHDRGIVERAYFEIVEMCVDMLKGVEGDKFHPLIREGYLNDLLKLISLSARTCKINELQSVDLKPGHFMVSGEDRLLRRVVEIFFADKKQTDKKYVESKKMVSLLRMFESHITSVDFEKVLEETMNEDIKNEGINLEKVVGKLVTNVEAVPKEYGSLNKDLIRQSLEDRLFFDKMNAQLEWYGSWLLDLIDEKDEKGKTTVDFLIESPGGTRFFEYSNQYKEAKGLVDQSIWKEKAISDFIKAVEEEAFPGLPVQFVVQGVLDYTNYLAIWENGEDFRKKYREEFSSSIWQKHSFLEKYWSTTRHYDHEIYKNSMLTERMDWGEIEDIENSLSNILVKMGDSE